MPELWEDGPGTTLPPTRTVRNEVESVRMTWAETQAFLLLEKNLALPYKPA
jgi:hypothetical protein